MTTSELVPWRGANVPLLAPEVSRATVQDYLNWIQWSQSYMGAPTPVTTYGNRPAEPISSSFEGFVWGMLYADGPVAAVEAYRLRVFGQAPLLYQEMKDGRPGDFFDDERLERLRTPWPGGNLGDLMKRALIYGDFGGNAFILDLDDELVLVRPDWVEIVLAKRMHRGGQVGWKQVGIVYYEGGLGVGDGVPFLPGEYAHFVPGLPDPLATYRGMSWLTPLVREVQADKSAGDHKVAFFENAASPNLAVSLPKEITPAQFKEFVDKMDAEHRGATQAYKTLYTAGGADVTVIGANMQQMDFSAVQGKGETRIANAGGVSPALLSFSEGMQGSSLNAGNFVPSKRNFVDTTMRDLWTNMSASIQKMDAFAPPQDRISRLSYDPRDIPFLRDDEQDIAQRQQTQASTLASLITAGFKPPSAQQFLVTDDPMSLEHSGLTSVQLMPPGSQDANGDGVPDGEAQAADEYQQALDEFRADLEPHWDEIARALESGEDEIERRYYDVRVAEGHVGGGRFRSLGDTAAALLNDWLDGKGDAEDPLDHFTQPQLKKIAEHHGIKTPPRAGKAALKLAILNDAKARHRDVHEGPKPRASFTLKGADHRDLDVGVYVERKPDSKIFLRREKDGRPGTILESFADLDALHSWAQEHGETELAGWAAKERDGSKPAAKVAPAKRAPAKKAAPLVAKPEQIREVVVDNAVREAYREAIAARPASSNGRTARDGDRVSLAAIRERVGEGYGRREVDDSLLRLQKSGGTLQTQENQQVLTQADRDSALRVGAREYHFLLLDDPSPRPVPEAPTGLGVDPRDRRTPNAGPNRYYRGLRSSMLHEKPHDFSDLIDEDLQDLRDFILSDPRRDRLYDKSIAAVDAELAKRGIPAKAEKRVPAKKAGRKRVAPWDPYPVYLESGKPGLRERLADLDLEQLRDIVADHGMDPSGLAMRWRDRDRVTDLIVARVSDRATKGHAFRPPAKKAAAIPPAEQAARPTFPPGQHSWSGHDGIDVTDQEEAGFRALSSAEEMKLYQRLQTGTAWQAGGQRGRYFGTHPDPSVPVSPERQAEIRAAIEDIAFRNGGRTGGLQYVTMEDVREGLAGRFDRTEVDNTILALNRTPDWTVVPESNQKALTPRGRLAAVVIGNQDKHVIQISRRGPSPVDREQAARDRQALVDRASAAHDAVAEVEQLLTDGASDRALSARITARGKLGTPPAITDRLLAAVGDEPAMRQVIADIRREEGLTPIGAPGDVVPFDPAKHRSIGGDIPRGAPVTVIRPGGRFERDGLGPNVLGEDGATFPAEVQEGVNAQPVEAAALGRMTEAELDAEFERGIAVARTGDSAGSAAIITAVGTERQRRVDVDAGRTPATADDIAVGRGVSLVTGEPHHPDSPRPSAPSVPTKATPEIDSLTAGLDLSSDQGIVDDAAADIAKGRPREDIAVDVRREADRLRGRAVARDGGTSAQSQREQARSDALFDFARRLEGGGAGPTAPASATLGAPTDARAVLDSPPVHVSARSIGRNVDDVRGLDHLTPAQREKVIDAVAAYRGLGYSGINQHLRTGQPARGAKGIVAGIDLGMAQSRLPHDVTVYRSLKTGESTLGPSADWPDDLTGREWTDLAYGSTTASQDIMAAQDNARVVMRVHVPAGTGAMKLSDHEMEVLLQRGLRYRVVADHGPSEITDGWGRTHRFDRMLDVEVVPADPEPSTVDRLASATSREEAHAALDGLTAAQLRDVAKATGSYVGDASTKDAMKTRIVEHTVGQRRNFQAITQGGWSSTPAKKAAPRIATADVSTALTDAGDDTSAISSILAPLNSSQLKDLARTYQIRGASKMRRDELVTALTDTVSRRNLASGVGETIAESAAKVRQAARPAAGDLPDRAPNTSPEIREAIRDARTIADVNIEARIEARRITGRHIPFDLDGSDLDVAKHFVEGILRGLEHAPKRAKVTRVGTYGPGGTISDPAFTRERMGDFVWESGHAVHIPESHIIGLNNHRASESGSADFLAQLLDGAMDGWSPKNTGTPMALAIHELGHSIATDAIATRAQKLLDREARRQDFVHPGDFEEEQISKYAATDRHELVAEAFLDVVMNGDEASRLSWAIYNLLMGIK